MRPTVTMAPHSPQTAETLIMGEHGPKHTTVKHRMFFRYNTARPRGQEAELLEGYGDPSGMQGYGGRPKAGQEEEGRGGRAGGFVVLCTG